ncbi:hypothetical protein FOZ62_023890, partial [Perkinsus olseni]
RGFCGKKGRKSAIYPTRSTALPDTLFPDSTSGLSFEALRKVLRGQPITWRHSSGYSASDDEVIDLPRFINVRAGDVKLKFLYDGNVVRRRASLSDCISYEQLLNQAITA